MLYAYEEGLDLRLICRTPVDVRKVTTDISYEQLFTFADRDIEGIQNKLVSFCQSHIDMKTLEVRQPADEDVDEIYDALASLHPFFLLSDHATALPDLLANTYNSLLISKKIELTRVEYMDRIYSLVSSAAELCLNEAGVAESYHDQNEMLERYYAQYQSGDKSGLTITFPVAFQTYVRAYLYWVLDASSVRFGALSSDERIRLFNRVFGDVNPWQPLCLKEISCVGMPGDRGMLRIINKANWRLAQSAIGRTDDYQSIGEELRREKDEAVEHTSYAKVFVELHSDEPDLDSDVGGWLKEQISEIKKETSQPLFKAYEISSFTDYILLQLRLLTEKSAIIKRCKNCGQYFITERTNIDYCQRILPGETQTCFVIGPRRVYNKALSDDLPRNLYAKGYKKYQARLRRKSITEEEFETWKTDAKRYLDDVQNGRITLEEYQTWMEQ